MIFLKKIYWVYILLVGFVFIFLVPPFQKPDEIYHYYHTYSSLNNSCVSIGSGGHMLVLKDVYEFPGKLQLEIIGLYERKFPISLLKQKYISSSNEKVVFNNSCTKFGYLSYLPNIIGFKLGGNNLLLGFYLSRFFGFLTFFIVFLVSLNLVGKYYPLVIAFSIIPMVIHQITAISYDSFHISLGLLSFSLYIYLKNNFSKVKLYLLFLFYILLLVFTLVKGGYFLLLILPVLLPSYPFFKKNIKNIIIKFLILIVYFLLAVFLIKSSIGYTDNIQKFIVDTVSQKKIVMEDPLYFVKVLSNTGLNEAYLYWTSFLGKFGWLDYELPFNVYLLTTFLIIFVISKFNFINKKNNNFKIIDIFELVFIFGITVGTYIIIHLGLYLAATKLAGETVTGVQGRYFFIPFLFLIYWLVRIIEIFGIKKVKSIFIGIILLVISINTVRAVYLRYYDYSGVYSDINELSLDDYKNYKKNNSKYKVIPVDNNRLCENIGDNKIGGFVIYLANNLKEKEYINDVFKYEVLSGNKVLYSGYLDQEKIQEEGMYLSKFKKILKSQDNGNICLMLSKKYSQSDSIFNLYFVEKQGVGVRFLKISR